MNKKVTVISGVSSGLGKEIASSYLSSGHLVVGFSRGNGTFGDPNYTHFQADIRDERQVIDLAEKIKRKFGRIDHYIHCAGIGSINHSLLMPGDMASNIISTNVLGTFLTCREMARLMKPEFGGRIVTLSSTASPLHMEGSALYAATKAAVESLTVTLAKELASFQITVNCVGPNPLNVGHVQGLSSERMENLLSRQSIRKLGTVEDVFEAIEVFLNPKNKMLTGQILYLGGVR